MFFRFCIYVFGFVLLCLNYCSSLIINSIIAQLGDGQVKTFKGFNCIQIMAVSSPYLPCVMIGERTGEGFPAGRQTIVRRINKILMQFSGGIREGDRKMGPFAVLV